ncbi:glycosyltransferase family 2 protein [Escherichia coli]|uniref:glycosyltransferase family 2 protein n=1 Tax=Escherichia coli TaxID=562 RepID=UPI00157CDCF0|nr:glycosyltransferase family 2 protein [Escherichia coli]NUC24586.1 glycosyltransferase family 2 protein [Escherichia coli]
MIDIAMATFNGSDFLKKQIASIQNQTYTNWRLIISDDGSSDDTLKIILDCMKDDCRIKLVNTSKKNGVVNNFNEALLHTTAPHIILCDQDDVWPNNKLEKLLCEMKSAELDNDLPVLIFTDLTLIDGDDNIIADSYYHVNKFNPKHNLKYNNLLWHSTIYGCSIILNRKLLNIALPIPSDVSMHDHWLSLIAMKYGKLIYYDFKSTFYRQHQNNQVGGRPNSFLFKMKKLPNYYRKIKLDAVHIKAHIKYLEEAKSERRKIWGGVILSILKSIIIGNKKMYSLCLLFLLVKI